MTATEVIDSTNSSEPAPLAAHDAVGQADDAETRVVPAALAAFVAAARAAGAAMDHTGAYSATAAATAVRDVLGVLEPMAQQITFYVGDYSGPGGAAMERAHTALMTAYAEAVEEQRHVAIGELALDATPSA